MLRKPRLEPREPDESELRVCAAIYACALVIAWLVGPRGPVYWDSFGYVTQAIQGRVGGLALGRPLFIWVSHEVARGYLAAGGSVWSLEAVLRTFWLLVAASAAPSTFALARALGLPRRVALLAALVVAGSPAMAHTSAAVLTDAPAVAMSTLATMLGVQAARDGSVRDAAAAGATLGIAVGLREQSVVVGVTLALLAWSAPAHAPGFAWRARCFVRLSRRRRCRC